MTATTLAPAHPTANSIALEKAASARAEKRMTLTAVKVIRVGPSGHSVTIQKTSAINSAIRIRNPFSIGGRKSGTRDREFCRLEDWLTELEATTRASATVSRARSVRIVPCCTSREDKSAVVR